MGLPEVLRAFGGMLLFLLPGFLLTLLFFRGRQVSLPERIPLAFVLSISLITLALFGLNRLYGVRINLSTCTVIVSIITIATVLALCLRSRFARRTKPGTKPPDSIEVPRQRLAEYVGLALVLAFAFVMAFLPHLHYAYPLHIDEWFHFGRSQALTEAQSMTFTEPFFGGGMVSDHYEIGFHLFLAEMKLFTGLPWVTIFNFFPAAIFTLTVLTSYAIGRRAHYGLGAAFFVALIPTTVRFLGPSFLVPVALGLLFLAVVVFLLERFEIGIAKVLVLLVLLACLFLCHPITAVAASIVCLIYGFVILLRGEEKGLRRWRSPLLIWGAVLLPCLLGFSRNWHSIAATVVGIRNVGGLPLVSDALPKFGFIPLALFTIGVGLLVLQGGKRAWGLILSSLAFLAIVFIFNWLEISRVPSFYDRSFMYLLLLAGIIAGFALTTLRRQLSGLLARFTKKAFLLSSLAALTLLVAAGVLGVRSHLNVPYYHLITTEKQYSDCLWIRDNLDDSYRKAVVDPTMAIAFSALTGKPVYAGNAVQLFSQSLVDETNKFLTGGASDTSWLVQRGIDIVYSTQPVNNPDLTEVRAGIYVVPEELRLGAHSS